MEINWIQWCALGGCADVSVAAGRNLEPAAGDCADKGNAAVN